MSRWLCLLALLCATAQAAPHAPADDEMGAFMADNGLLSRLDGVRHSVTDRASDLVVTAMGFLGVPYRRGGNSVETGFDCSGFVRAMFEQTVGLILPRRANEQAAATELIDRKDLQPGDLVFFNTMGVAKLNVNGTVREFEAEGDTPLLWVLREQLGLTGTKYGCGIAAVRRLHCAHRRRAHPQLRAPVSASAPTKRSSPSKGLSPDGSHPVQKAWVALDVPQCGYCQCGMVMAAAALLRDKPKPTDQDIDEAITNICRCGTYNRIRAAIKVVADGGNTKTAGLAIDSTPTGASHEPSSARPAAVPHPLPPAA
jgi:isoquinoline 1-oxidoreductase alpha subunit